MFVLFSLFEERHGKGNFLSLVVSSRVSVPLLFVDSLVVLLFCHFQGEGYSLQGYSLHIEPKLISEVPTKIHLTLFACVSYSDVFLSSRTPAKNQQ